MMIRTLVTRSGSSVRMIFSPAISISTASSRGICHKDNMDKEVIKYKPAPWPWRTKKFSWWHQNFFRMDRTIKRWDENSKIICIEGNVGSGKDAFGKELAKKLGMIYIGPPDLDDMWITSSGFDWRTLNWRLPNKAQFCDINFFHLNPQHPGLIQMQWMMWTMRLVDYLDALSHIFNTGQGVVINRSVFSDSVFWKAMNRHGYSIQDDSMKLYRICCVEVLSLLMRPHLIVYLDKPVDECLATIKKRNKEHEVNSEVYSNTDYLSTLEQLYKEDYLEKGSAHAELLMYDWSESGRKDHDMDLVVEDIEKLDFDFYEIQGKSEKMSDWRYFAETDFDDLRRFYTNCRGDIYKYMNQPDYWVTSATLSNDDAELRHIIMNTDGQLFATGFEPGKDSLFQRLFGWDRGTYIDKQNSDLHNVFLPRRYNP